MGPSSPAVNLSGDQAEVRLLRAHNEALQRQLTLKDQGISRLRHKVQERALLLSHGQGSGGSMLHNSKVAMLEAENARLRGDVSHRTSQLHSAVARIAALKERIDDLLRRPTPSYCHHLLLCSTLSQPNFLLSNIPMTDGSCITPIVNLVNVRCTGTSMSYRRPRSVRPSVQQPRSGGERSELSSKARSRLQSSPNARPWVRLVTSQCV